MEYPGSTVHDAYSVKEKGCTVKDTHVGVHPTTGSTPIAQYRSRDPSGTEGADRRRLQRSAHEALKRVS